MKALTLTQPWATLVAIGAKRIETRSWPTAYRGPLAIHAAKGFPEWAKTTAEEPTFSRELGTDILPVGCIVAVCQLVSCVPTRDLQWNALVDFDADVRTEDRSVMLDDREREFGDYSLGRWAWLLADVRKLDEPIPAKGMLQLWEWQQPAGLL
jgi:hypothetical protein